MFTDFGIGQSIIQNPRGEERAFRNTAWTIQAARGLGLWLVLIAIAPFVADFYDQPVLAAMVGVAGLGIALGGFEATSLHVRGRNLDVRAVTLELVSQIVGTEFAVGWVLIHPTPWALIGSMLAAQLTKTIGSHLLLGTGDRLAWDPAAACDLPFREVDLRQHAADVPGAARRPSGVREAHPHRRRRRLQRRGDAPAIRWSFRRSSLSR